MNIWSFMTLIMFICFVGICLLIMIPIGGKKAFQDAEKLALKEENDPLITPRTKHLAKNED